jgi:hypothetical protein
MKRQIIFVNPCEEPIYTSGWNIPEQRTQLGQISLEVISLYIGIFSGRLESAGKSAETLFYAPDYPVDFLHSHLNEAVNPLLYFPRLIS